MVTRADSGRLGVDDRKPEPLSSGDTEGVSVLSRRDAVERLTAACPSFPDWRDDESLLHDDGEPIGHAVIAQLCGHLMTMLERGETYELDQVLAEAERISEEGDPEAVDLAHTGVVEDLYNAASWAVASGSSVSPGMIRDKLGPLCKGYWDAWDAFGRREPDPNTAPG